jgi:predicted dienelactone hydrolase
MHFASVRRLALSTATALLLLAPASVRAQGKPEEVQFDSADKVEIKGSFYPSANGNKSPCVILLHEIGSDRTKGGWDELAKALQKEGFAVLAFDFRGHNDSTTVDPMFFKVQSNFLTFKPKPNQTTIDWKTMQKSKTYLPMLVNDIAAAKQYIETRNDANNCNASNVFIVGAKEGAALGALWLANESKRMRVIPNPINPNLPPTPHPKGGVYADDIAGAIWLSMPDRLGGQQTSTFLRSASVGNKIPMCFAYGSKDTLGSTTATNVLKSLKSMKAPAATLALEVKGTNAAGSELLTKEGVEKKIVNYVNNVLEKQKEKAWGTRDSAKLPPLALIPLKLYGYQLP